MKCRKCGAEQPEDNKICAQCGADMTELPEETGGTEPAEGTQGEGAQAEEAQAEEAQEEGTQEEGTQVVEAQMEEAQEEKREETLQTVQKPDVPEKEKKKGKMVGIAVGAAAVVAVAVLAAVKLTAKDPKEVVIEAFERVYSDEIIYPSEELFGTREFAESSVGADSQFSMDIKMDSSTDEMLNAYVGSGFRLEGKSDITNSKSSMNMGIIYNGMDLVNLNAYYGDDIMMLSVPELSDYVFTADLGEGLAERIKNSPVMGPVLAEANVDVDGLAAYFTEVIDESQKQQAEGKTPFDLETLLNRYKEGCQAQDNLKAALTVEKAEKGTYVVNGKETSCRGYHVVVSKDSMIEFLRTSSDFFLQDETLKGDFLHQLEMTVRISELMGGTYVEGTEPMSAQEMQQQSYDEMKKAVDEGIAVLEQALTDIDMTVFVDKKGNLAAIQGTTSVLDNQTNETADLAFHFQLEGGAYPTQNAKADLTLTDQLGTSSVSLIKQGTYDGKKLTCDLSLDLLLAGEKSEPYSLMYTGTYDSSDGSYHIAGEAAANGAKLAGVSCQGVIDKLEKGKSIHIAMDSLEISAPSLTADDPAAVSETDAYMTLSGAFGYEPLSGEIAPLEGEPFDMMAATEEEWYSVMLEMVFGVFGLTAFEAQ